MGRIVVVLLALLSLVDPAFASGASGQPGIGELLGRMAPMFLMLFIIFYFMIIKPQQAKLKSQENLLKSLKKGDLVVTSGGMIVRVSHVEGAEINVELAPNTKAKFEIAHIAKKYESDDKRSGS